MTTENPADVIEAVALAIGKHRHGSQEAWDEDRRLARALADAGLLADPADRDELEAWRSGRRRKAWPTIESVPDGLHYAAELARAQGTEGGEAHDELLRQAATRLKNLNDHARMLLAEKERAEAKLAQTEVALGEAMSAEVAELREWRRKILDIMGYYDTPEYAEELLTYLPVWKAEGEADRGHITELRAQVAAVRALSDEWERALSDTLRVEIDELRAALDPDGGES